jgi:hypothetical protein
VYHAQRATAKRGGTTKADMVSSLVGKHTTLASHADDLERLTRATLTALMGI